MRPTIWKHVSACVVAGLVTLGGGVSAVHAQTPAVMDRASNKAKRSDPMDPKAAVPALRHESVMSGYRRTGEDTTVPWKEANDTVTRIGGWRVYLREAHEGQAAPTPAQPPAPASQPTPASSQRVSPPAITGTAPPPARPSSSDTPTAHPHGHHAPSGRRQP